MLTMLSPSISPLFSVAPMLGRAFGLPWPPGFFFDCFCCGGAIGYHLGGSTASGSTTATEKTTFADDVTVLVTTADISTERHGAGPIGKPDVAGYFSGGATTSPDTVVGDTEKLTFSNEVTSSVGTATLSTSRSEIAGLSERDTKGYFLGGSTDDLISGITVVADKFTFSSETASALGSADLSVARYGHTGISDGTTKGYVGGGATGSLSYIVSSDKLVYSTDTTAAQTTADLSVARQDYTSVSNGDTKGYFCGGNTGGTSSVWDILTFSTDTTAANTSGVSHWTATGNSDGVSAYIGGGISSGYTLHIDKLTFATDSLAGVSVVDLDFSHSRGWGLCTTAL